MKLKIGIIAMVALGWSILGSQEQQQHNEWIDTTVVSFQQGVNGYEGTFQKRIGANFLEELGELAPFYYLDGNAFDDTANDTMDLIWFRDIIGSGAGQIPAGATILNAQLIYSTGEDSNANADGPYMIGKLGQMVDEFTTYEGLNASNFEDLPGLRAARSIIVGQPLAGYADIAGLEVVSADITSFVQNWVNGESNFGMTVFTNDTNNGWQVNTIGNEDLSLRPKLVVEYTAEPALKSNTYSATQSAWVDTGAVNDGSTIDAQFLDLGADFVTEALLKFGDLFGENVGQIGQKDQIVKALLTVYTPGAPDFSANADSDDPILVHQVMTDWNLDSAFGSDGVSETAGLIAPAAAELLGMGENCYSIVDITSIISNWKAGQPNYGINLRPIAGDGWQMYFPGVAQPEIAPSLTIWTVEVQGAPVASFEVNQAQFTPPFTVQFDGSASEDPDGGVVTLIWDFGDGTTGEGVQVSHEYTEVGTYTVTLTVTDDEDEVSQAITTITAMGEPVAFLNTSTLTGPAPFRFIANSAGSLDPDSGALSYAWNFGDGAVSSDESVSHVFSEPGRYTVTLTITDDEGSVDSKSVEVGVYPTSTQTVVFQQGLNGYEGTFQKRVSMGAISELGSDVQKYYLDGRPQTEAEMNNDTADLIRFDNIFGDIPGAIPANANIVSAKLTYSTGDDGFANADGPYVIGRLTTPFDELTTYADLDIFQIFPEERGPRGVVAPKVLAGFAGMAILEVVEADVTDFVKDWQNGEPNFGMTVYTDDTTNGWEIKTIGNDEISARPKLTVTYTTRPVKEYRFLVNESAIVRPGQDTIDGAFTTEIFMDGGADLSEAVLKFNDLFGNGPDQIGANERILSAQLIVETGGVYTGTSSNADADHEYFVHQMLIDWSATELTHPFGDDGITVNVEGSAPVSAFLGMGESSEAKADVTSVLYNWSAGQENYGLGISPGGTDGWQFFFPGILDFAPDETIPTLWVLTEESIGDIPDRDQPIEITSFNVNAGNIELTWTSSESAVYTIETSTDLNVWNAEVADIASGGSMTSASVSIEAGVKFIRIRK